MIFKVHPESAEETQRDLFLQRKEISASISKDFLIRNMPMDLYLRLEKAAKEHHRSRTQEAIFILSQGLAPIVPPLKVPKAFRWGKNFTSSEIISAIHEGRE
jgi:plasmid stability protein